MCHDVPRHVDRYGKTDADVAAARGDDGGIDADQLAAQVDQRAAGVAHVDGCVGLDEILVALDAQPAASERADNPGGDRLSEPERVADGHHEVAHAKRIGVSQLHRGQAVSLHLDYRHVRGRIGAHHLRVEPASIAQGDGNFLGLVDDVIVGDDVTVLGIDNDAGAETLGPPMARPIGQLEEATEKRVTEQGVLAHENGALRGDIHHRRRDLLQHGGEARKLATLDRRRQRGLGRPRRDQQRRCENKRNAVRGCSSCVPSHH